MNNKDLIDFLINQTSKTTTYYDPILFKSGEFGFSVKREYEENIRFKPTKNQNNKNDDVCLLKIALNDWDNAENDKYIYFHASASKFSKYISKKPFYDFNDKECPLPESIKNSNSTPQPQDLSLNFRINKLTNEISYGNKTYTLIEIFEKLYNEHIYKTTYQFHLNEIRKIKLNRYLLSPFRLTIYIFEFFLKLNFGREILDKQIEKDDSPGVLDIELVEYDKKVKLFEYETSVISIFTFTSYFALFYIYYQKSFYKFYTIDTILNSSALLLLFGINLLIIYDYILPKIIFYMLKKIKKLQAILTEAIYKK
ncbi:hypothetical protein [Leptospira kanakyensis]|uniref:hypothetical protein n=1 Tax=Leptospira kanakyensis TaxID=2484968 RepID=UPI00223C9450|nr:hypothetical protein [Leptospira kanakyensis]MCW7483281.1 hypothetical protein [Leptospira kanakyensis]